MDWEAAPAGIPCATAPVGRPGEPGAAELSPIGCGARCDRRSVPGPMAAARGGRIAVHRPRPGRGVSIAAAQSERGFLVEAAWQLDVEHLEDPEHQARRQKRVAAEAKKLSSRRFRPGTGRRRAAGAARYRPAAPRTPRGGDGPRSGFQVRAARRGRSCRWRLSGNRSTALNPLVSSIPAGGLPGSRAAARPQGAEIDIHPPGVT